MRPPLLHHTFKPVKPASADQKEAACALGQKEMDGEANLWAHSRVMRVQVLVTNSWELGVFVQVRSGNQPKLPVSGSPPILKHTLGSNGVADCIAAKAAPSESMTQSA